MSASKAPALAVAPRAYEQEYFNQLLGQLRVYFNAIDINSTIPSWNNTYSAYHAFAMKASDQNITNNNTPTNDPDLFFNIGANQIWGGRIFVPLISGLTTTGVKTAFSVPAGASGTVNAWILTDASGGKELQARHSGTITATLDFTAASFPASVTLGMLKIVFRVANGTTAGQVNLQLSQSTSSGTALTIGAAGQMSCDRSV